MKPTPAGIEHNGARLIFENSTYVRGRKRIKLTRREQQVLTMLMRRPGRFVRRESMAQKIFGDPDSSGPEVYVYYLRVKGINLIINKSRRGYCYCGVCKECNGK